MAKGAWGRPCGDIFWVFLGAGNSWGDLNIYYQHRRHLLKFIVELLAGRTPFLEPAQRLCQRRQKKVTQILIACSRYLGSHIYSPSELCHSAVMRRLLAVAQETTDRQREQKKLMRLLENRHRIISVWQPQQKETSRFAPL
jgi:hypothetical protein